MVVVANEDERTTEVKNLGVEYEKLDLSLKGLNPLTDFKTILLYVQLFQKYRPDHVYSFTIKPVIYSSLAARLLKIPATSTITGLGTAFLRKGLLQFIASCMYKISIRSNKKVIFQNKTDQKMFIDRGLAPKERTICVNGSGINLKYFNPRGNISEPGKISFLMIARPLYDKGIQEYVDAISLVRSKTNKLDIEFRFLGPIESENRSMVPSSIFQKWLQDGIFNYLGYHKDPRPFIATSDVVVLPSYREGLSRSLIEAAAMGKPIIATNVPGCMEVVDEPHNGFLCEPKNARDLAEKISKMVDIKASGKIDALGIYSRKKAEQDFSEHKILKEYISSLR